MDPDPEPLQHSLILLQSIFSHNAGDTVLYGLLGLLLLIIFVLFSAMFSSSENAFFSLSPNDLVVLNEENSVNSKVALELINDPDRKTATRKLLATILLMNNLVNIFIVIFSTSLFEYVFNIDYIGPQVTFLIEVVLITFILVLLGEVIPKIYATQNNLQIIHIMARPLKWCGIIFRPVIVVLSSSSNLFDRYLKKRYHSISMEEISQAIDIADEDKEIEEKHILKGLINFGNTSVKQIMKPRTEVACIELSSTSAELMKHVSEWSYSRIPVFEESFDNIKGILYIKDLLPYLHEKDEFNWRSLLRAPLFVPEQKKIDDLLEEFQEKRIHMAIVVDEYGGTSGIVTMEDILEEVFGEIRDEFDEDEMVYSKLDEQTFVFEGKTSLNDVAKIIDIDSAYFDEIRGDSDTLGGLILELHKSIPEKGAEIQENGFRFIVESVDARRIKRVKLEFDKEELEEGSDD